jgi:hypothetical protein
MPLTHKRPRSQSDEEVGVLERRAGVAPGTRDPLACRIDGHRDRFWAEEEMTG